MTTHTYLRTMLTQHIASLTLLRRLFSLPQKVKIIYILPCILNLKKIIAMQGSLVVKYTRPQGNVRCMITVYTRTSGLLLFLYVTLWFCTRNHYNIYSYLYIEINCPSRINFAYKIANCSTCKMSLKQYPQINVHANDIIINFEL